MARIAGSDSVKTKALICEQALNLTVLTGFEALTMRALAGACGLQVAAIYHYFPDKQSMLSSLLNAHFDQLLEAARALPITGSPLSRLTSFSRHHIQFHANHRAQTLLAAQELRSLNRASSGIILPKRQAYERLLRQILSDGQADKSFMIQDVSLTAAAMLAMLSEVSVWFRPGGKATLQEVADVYAQMIAKMAIGAQ